MNKLFLKRDDHGFSLLHWASWDGHLNIVEILVNKGAKINSVNKCILIFLINFLKLIKFS